MPQYMVSFMLQKSDSTVRKYIFRVIIEDNLNEKLYIKHLYLMSFDGKFNNKKILNRDIILRIDKVLNPYRRRLFMKWSANKINDCSMNNQNTNTAVTILVNLQKKKKNREIRTRKYKIKTTIRRKNARIFDIPIIKDFMCDIEIFENNEYFYIVISKKYAQENKFKIGKTVSLQF